MLDAVSELLGQTLAKNHNTYVLLLCMKNVIGDTKKNQKKTICPFNSKVFLWHSTSPPFYNCNELKLYDWMQIADKHNKKIAQN